MQFKIDWIETKKPDWKIATVTGIDGIQHSDCSINRTGKQGEVFPDFEALAPGHTIEADLWNSPAGKNYLFAPKPKTAGRSGGGPRAAVVEAAQDRKAGHIKEAQENKERSIMVASAMRDATVLLEYAFGSEIEQLPPHERMPAIARHHKEIREWYLKEWAVVEKSLDVPFP